MGGPNFVGLGQLRIDSSSSSYFINGSVGIGTSTPAARLHVNSSSDAVLRIQTTQGSGKSFDIISGLIAGQAALRVRDATAGADRLMLADTGHMAIAVRGATAPPWWGIEGLTVRYDTMSGAYTQGGVRIERTDAPTVAWKLMNDAWDNSFRITNDANALLYLSSSTGNLGVGTNPQARLDVAGGAVRVGGQEVINSSGQVLYA